MSLTASIVTGGVNSHQTTAEEANALATDILNPGVIGTVGNTSGVAPATGGYSVNAQGSPDTTVAVGSGVIYVTATPTGGNSQRVRVKNSASANVTIAANATGSTRYDWIYVKVDPDKLTAPNVSATDVATLVTSRSTSATTDNGTPPTYGTLIAVVTVANGFSTITNGTVADKRAQALTGINSASSFFAIYDFVESGCVWSGDAYASTLNASMTAGYIWIGGVRLSVTAVTARAFTASKDTYVDASNNGDGTALLTYTANTTNAASPALAAGSVRIAIVISGASSIAAASSINQGHTSTPVVSSVPLLGADSLGNIIYPHGRTPTTKVTVPYKFSVYRGNSLTATSSAQTLMPFDTKLYDDGVNIDVVTNKGRFTAPVSGLYMFNAQVQWAGGSSIRSFLSLYKNGSEAKRGNDVTYTGTQQTASVTGQLFLAATDYVEVFYFVGGALAGSTNQNTNWFDGYLVGVS